MALGDIFMRRPNDPLLEALQAGEQNLESMREVERLGEPESWASIPDRGVDPLLNARMPAVTELYTGITPEGSKTVNAREEAVSPSEVLRRLDTRQPSSRTGRPAETSPRASQTPGTLSLEQYDAINRWVTPAKPIASAPTLAQVQFNSIANRAGYTRESGAAAGRVDQAARTGDFRSLSGDDIAKARNLLKVETTTGQSRAARLRLMQSLDVVDQRVTAEVTKLRGMIETTLPSTPDEYDEALRGAIKAGYSPAAVAQLAANPPESIKEHLAAVRETSIKAAIKEAEDQRAFERDIDKEEFVRSLESKTKEAEEWRKVEYEELPRIASKVGVSPAVLSDTLQRAKAGDTGALNRLNAYRAELVSAEDEDKTRSSRTSSGANAVGLPMNWGNPEASKARLQDLQQRAVLSGVDAKLATAQIDDIPVTPDMQFRNLSDSTTRGAAEVAKRLRENPDLDPMQAAEAVVAAQERDNSVTVEGNQELGRRYLATEIAKEARRTARLAAERGVTEAGQQNAVETARLKKRVGELAPVTADLVQGIVDEVDDARFAEDPQNEPLRLAMRYVSREADKLGVPEAAESLKDAIAGTEPQAPALSDESTPVDILQARVVNIANGISALRATRERAKRVLIESMLTPEAKLMFGENVVLVTENGKHQLYDGRVPDIQRRVERLHEMEKDQDVRLLSYRQAVKQVNGVWTIGAIPEADRVYANYDEPAHLTTATEDQKLRNAIRDAYGRAEAGEAEAYRAADPQRWMRATNLTGEKAGVVAMELEKVFAKYTSPSATKQLNRETVARSVDDIVDDLELSGSVGKKVAEALTAQMTADPMIRAMVTSGSGKLFRSAVNISLARETERAQARMSLSASTYTAGVYDDLRREGFDVKTKDPDEAAQIADRFQKAARDFERDIRDEVETLETLGATPDQIKAKAFESLKVKTGMPSEIARQFMDRVVVMDREAVLAAISKMPNPRAGEPPARNPKVVAELGAWKYIDEEMSTVSATDVTFGWWRDVTGGNWHDESAMQAQKKPLIRSVLRSALKGRMTDEKFEQWWEKAWKAARARAEEDAVEMYRNTLLDEELDDSLTPDQRRALGE